MFNVLLSLFALVLGAVPETDAAPPERAVLSQFVPQGFKKARNAAPAEQRLRVDTVFQENVDDPVTPAVQYPDWMGQQTVIRGQSGTYDSPPTTSPFGGPSQPYQPLSPFQGGTDPVLPYLNEPGPVIVSGINGPQPERVGFTPTFDGAFIIPSSASGNGANGHFGVQEYDTALRHVSVLGSSWIFSNTAQGGMRVWTGPSSPNLPPEVYRFGWDFNLTTPQAGPWSVQLDFNPSVNTDFQSQLAHESINLDGSATAFYRVSPQFMWVLGVQYWDRVQNIIIPNAGAVWNPSDRWELRLTFPKTRVSYFLGNLGDAAHWIYGVGEYHVESYQIEMPGVGTNQIQLSDYRLAIGLRSDHPTYDKFVEVGYVLDRQARFLYTTPGFNINDGLMARLGIRF